MLKIYFHYYLLTFLLSLDKAVCKTHMTRSLKIFSAIFWLVTFDFQFRRSRLFLAREKDCPPIKNLSKRNSWALFVFFSWSETPGSKRVLLLLVLMTESSILLSLLRSDFIDLMTAFLHLQTWLRVFMRLLSFLVAVALDTNRKKTDLLKMS